MRSRTLVAVFAAALGPASIAAFACGGSAESTTVEADGSSSSSSSSGAPGSSSSSGFGGTDSCGDLAMGGPGVVDAAALMDGAFPDADMFGRLPYDFCAEPCSPYVPAARSCSSDGDGGVYCFEWCLGRRPAGLSASAARPMDLFAEMARLEAASVPAFRSLARDLVRLRAPKRLVRAARRSARDEQRHARAMRAIAKRRGEGRLPVNIASNRRDRSLEEIAIENAVEGCVRETWGALLAHHQATRAPDVDLRAKMKRIARDETEHAALSWRILAWSTSRLDRSARARVRIAMRTAVAELHRGAIDLPNELGLPRAAEQRRLLAGLARTLWLR